MAERSTLKMHKYVLSLVALMGGFVVTFPIAISRVSSTEQFAGQPFHSQTCETKQPKERKVVSWLATCAQMTVAPLPTKVDLGSPKP
ncbi:MAG: hypothetical protein WCD18_16685 [Thermosynechococcaceae cyanobacterium]